MSEPYLALQVIMMPRDANPTPAVSSGGVPCPVYNTIFGGVLLSYLDQAGAVGAIREVLQRGGPRPFLVTVAINRVEFKKPVLVGDLVSVARPWTKWAAEVERVEDIPVAVRRAIQIARTPPTGPVFLSLPSDVLRLEGEFDVEPPAEIG